jgi:hypothetical protein
MSGMNAVSRFNGTSDRSTPLDARIIADVRRIISP